MLTMDMEPAALGSLEDAALVIRSAVAAVDIARRAGAQVCSVHMAFTEEELRAVPATSCLAASVAAAGAALRVGSPATAVHPEVAPLPGDIVVRKTRVGPFHGSDLNDRLRERGVDTVVLAGVQTSGVVLTADREAADRDYRILVVADACADPDRDLHDLPYAPDISPPSRGGADLSACRDFRSHSGAPHVTVSIPAAATHI